MDHSSDSIRGPSQSSDARLSLRVGAVQEAIKRARFAFFLCVLASGASFACLWNTHFSWDRGLAFGELPAVRGTPSESNLKENTRRAIVEDALRAWVDSQTVSISLVGIRIAVSDFAILNSLALYLFVYYYLLSVRRGNREIGQILRDIQSPTNTQSYTVYTAISAYMVFNLNRTDDNPIGSLDPADDAPETKIRTIRWVAEALSFTPLIVVVFTIVCDVCSLFVKKHLFFSSPFRPGSIAGVLRAMFQS